LYRKYRVTDNIFYTFNEYGIMKKITLLLVLMPFLGMAQQAEVGLTGGFTANTAPSGSIYYIANKPVENFAASATFVGNIKNTNFQLGVDIYALGLSNKASQALPIPYFGRIIVGNGETFTYAKAVISVSPIANYKVKISDDGYVYGGLALGLAGSYAEPQSHNNSDGSAVTFRGINGGFGFTAGGQLGVSYAITTRIALNAEFALRYYHLTFATSETYPPGGATSVSLGTLAYPLTFGIRYRMGFEKQLNYENGRYQVIRKRDQKRKSHTEK